MKAPLVDNTWSNEMTGFHHPASFCQISIWKTSKTVVRVCLDELPCRLRTFEVGQQGEGRKRVPAPSSKSRSTALAYTTAVHMHPSAILWVLLKASTSPDWG